MEKLLAEQAPYRVIVSTSSAIDALKGLMLQQRVKALIFCHYI